MPYNAPPPHNSITPLLHYSITPLLHYSNTTMAGNSYWEEIEWYFSKKRGSALILSPKDWPLVMSWQERGIPLELIYQGIDRAFDRFEARQTAKKHRTIQNLSYCRHDVEKLWKEQEESFKIISPPADILPEAQHAREKQQITTKIRSISNQLRKLAFEPHYYYIQNALTASADGLERLLPSVEESKDKADLVEIKDRMRHMEKHLLVELGQAIGPEQHQKILERAEAQLASHKGNMKEHVYRETLQIVVAQLLRDSYPFPSFL